MKKTTILLVLAILSFGLANAQNTAMRASVEHRAEKQTQIFKNQLLLSSEQNDIVYEMVHASIKQLDILKEEMKTKHGEEGEIYNRNSLRKLRLEFEKGMKSILTPDQFKKWQKNRSQKMETVVKKDKSKKKEMEIIESENIF